MSSPGALLPRSSRDAPEIDVLLPSRIERPCTTCALLVICFCTARALRVCSSCTARTQLHRLCTAQARRPPWADCALLGRCSRIPCALLPHRSYSACTQLARHTCTARALLVYCTPTAAAGPPCRRAPTCRLGLVCMTISPRIPCALIPHCSCYACVLLARRTCTARALLAQRSSWSSMVLSPNCVYASSA
jgi:hypothetical protein